MMILPLASLAGVLLGWLMAFLSLFLIMLILIQRGKGGGLTGALGGPGGQSAFGSKAGDTFTAITIVVASLWGITCVITMLVLGDGGSSAETAAASPVAVQDAGIDDEESAGGGANLGGDILSDGFVGKTDEGEVEEADSTTPSADLKPAETDSSESDAVDAESTDNAEESGDVSAATEESE